MSQSQSTQKKNKSTNSSTENQHPVTDKVRETLHESVETFSEKAASTEAKLRDTAHTSSETLSEKHKELESKWQRSNVRQYATKNPVATAGLAFAAGALLTALLKNK